MQNPGIFRTEVYSELWDTQNTRQIQNSVKHLRWSVEQKLLTAILVFANYIFAISAFQVLYFLKFNKSQFHSPKVLVLCKKA